MNYQSAALTHYIDLLTSEAVRVTTELRIAELIGEHQQRNYDLSSPFQVLGCYNSTVNYIVSFLEPEPEPIPEPEPKTKLTNESLYLASVKVSELKKALSLLRQSVKGRDFRDVMAVQCESGILSLYGSNIQTTNQYLIGNIDAPDFRYLTTYSTFKDAITKLPKHASVDLSLKQVTCGDWDTQELILTHNKFKFCLQCLDASVYPETPLSEGYETLIVDKKFLNEIKLISKSVAKNSRNQCLEGIHFLAQNGRLILEASDSHKLTQKQSISTAAIIDVIIRPELFPSTTQVSDTCRIMVGHERAFIQTGNLIRSTILIEGKFPSLDHLERSGQAVTLIVDRLELKNQLEIARAYIRSGVRNTRLKISADSQTQTLDFCWIDGEIGFNSAIASHQKFTSQKSIVIDPLLALEVLNGTSCDMVAITLGCSFGSELPCIGIDTGTLTWLAGCLSTIYDKPEAQPSDPVAA